jgi:5-methyltetrahydrofolate corrinoid/iron sulfur protein methyltransferase
MILIGERIHIISKEIKGAIVKRHPEPIQKLARLQAEAGADYLDLNLGPLPKDPLDTMQWIVNTVQEAVDIPLSIDTNNPIAMESALKICKITPLINAANGTQFSKETMLPLAQKYSADVVFLTFNDDRMASDADERVAMAMELVEEANDMGIPNERIWIDGVLMPISSSQDQVVQYLEFAKMFQEALPGVNNLTGLSNVSSCGTPPELRGLLNRTLYIVLNRYGHSALIADVLDEELMQLHRGELPELVDLVYKALEGEDIDLGSLSEREKNYLKTVDILTEKKLYSHSWLEQ